MHRVAVGENAHLTVDQVDERDLTFGVAHMPAGIDHRLRPVQQPVLDRGRGNPSLIARQAETNDGLNDGKQILDAVL